MLDPAHGKKVESVRASFAAVVAVLAAALLASPALPADLKPKEFSDAIRAFDREDWAKGAELMEKAARKQKEDGELTRIYGTRFEPYLPHYFWGLALYRQGKCAEALAQWDQCLKTGAVQRTDKQDLLLLYSDDCRRRTATSAGLSLFRESPAGPSHQFLQIQRLQTDRP